MEVTISCRRLSQASRPKPHSKTPIDEFGASACHMGSGELSPEIRGRGGHGGGKVKQAEGGGGGGGGGGGWV